MNWQAVSLGVVLFAVPVCAGAHVSIVSDAGRAGATQVVEFGVGHGCDGSDTYAVTIEIPAGVTSVRPMYGGLGNPSVAVDEHGHVTAISWQKDDADVLDADSAYYVLAARMKLPDAPFTQLHFPAVQTCRAADGTISTAACTEVGGGHGHGGGGHGGHATSVAQAQSGGEVGPAPELTILPPRLPGWNRYVASDHMHDLTLFFRDAIIVWKGSLAYSYNPTTAAQIEATQGVLPLSEIHPDEEFWVRY